MIHKRISENREAMKTNRFGSRTDTPYSPAEIDDNLNIALTVTTLRLTACGIRIVGVYRLANQERQFGRP